MENIFGYIINGFFALVGIVIVSGIGIKIVRNRTGREKTVEAVVADKQCYDKLVYGKNLPPYTKKEYVITFSCNNKKLHFTISEASYDTYCINQKGLLTYKGQRLIDFKGRV